MRAPASATTSANLLISARRKLLSSWGLDDSGGAPILSSVSATCGLFRALTVAACRRATMADGVPRGTTRQYQDVTSIGNPVSMNVGTSGMTGVRFTPE